MSERHKVYNFKKIKRVNSTHVIDGKEGVSEKKKRFLKAS